MAILSTGSNFKGEIFFNGYVFVIMNVSEIMNINYSGFWKMIIEYIFWVSI